METTLNDIPMMYIVADGGPAGAREAFDRLEGKLPSLRGRKFYGTFQPATGEYRACVAVESVDDPQRMGLATGVIPGGLYLREKMKNWSSRIGAARHSWPWRNGRAIGSTRVVPVLSSIEARMN